MLFNICLFFFFLRILYFHNVCVPYIDEIVGDTVAKNAVLIDKKGKASKTIADQNNDTKKNNDLSSRTLAPPTYKKVRMQKIYLIIYMFYIVLSILIIASFLFFLAWTKINNSGHGWHLSIYFKSKKC